MGLSHNCDSLSDDQISGKRKNVTPKCARCGSTEIVRNARLIWDLSKQDWVLNKVFYGFVCLNCEDATNLVWV